MNIVQQVTCFHTAAWLLLVTTLCNELNICKSSLGFVRYVVLYPDGIHLSIISWN